MKLETLDDLLIEQLKDLYSAEKQLKAALPKMAKKAENPELKRAFETHLGETEIHIERLEEVFELLDHKATAHTCEAMKGLVKEGEEMIEKEGHPAVIDAGLIAAAQRVEHYEIAAYGTVCTFAQQLGYTKAEKLLYKTLEEEKATDLKLTKIAETRVNVEA